MRRFMKVGARFPRPYLAGLPALVAVSCLAATPEGPRPRPAIDAAAPAHIETATLALG